MNLRALCLPFAPRPAPATPPTATVTSSSLSEELAVPSYVLGGGLTALTSMASFAALHPAGGFSVQPTGIVMNPDWTHNFGPGSAMGTALPLAAGVTSAFFLARCGLELYEGKGSTRAQVAAALDLTLAITSAAQILNPPLAGAATVVFLIARGLVDAAG